MQKVKGAVLKSRLAFITEHAGMDGLQQVLALLPAGDRQVLDGLLTMSWYPFELGKRLDDAIVKVVGKGDAQFFRRLGRASADRNLTTVHKSFMTLGDPHGFLAKSPQIYTLYYDTGRREYERTGERSGVVTTRDAETFSAPDCLTVAGWYERALEICGVKKAKVTEVECRAKGGAACRYEVSWE
jgi:uncharacterized protein (TIGR02265 family)